jgi:hypothetical protein
VKCLAHDDADVFHRVVFVDIEIAFGLHRQIEEAMLASNSSM